MIYTQYDYPTRDYIILGERILNDFGEFEEELNNSSIPLYTQLNLLISCEILFHVTFMDELDLYLVTPESARYVLPSRNSQYMDFQDGLIKELVPKFGLFNVSDREASYSDHWFHSYELAYDGRFESPVGFKMFSVQIPASGAARLHALVTIDEASAYASGRMGAVQFKDWEILEDWLRELDFCSELEVELPAPEISFRRIRSELNDIENKIIQAKSEYMAALAKQKKWAQYKTSATLNKQLLDNSIEDLKKFIADYPAYAAHKVVFEEASGREYDLVISLMRNEKIMTPFDGGSSYVIEELVEGFNQGLEREWDDELEEYMEHPDEKFADNYEDHGEFIMPPAIIKCNLHLDQTFEITSSSMFINPYTSRKSYPGYWDGKQAHPHSPGLNSSSSPCLGDYDVPLAEAGQQADFISIATMIDMFCNNYNQYDSAGYYVLNWPQPH